MSDPELRWTDFGCVLADAGYGMSGRFRRAIGDAHDKDGQHLPGEAVWVVGEHRSTGERKYYLSNLPADTPLKQLAGAIKARWVCEQAHQQ